MVAPATSPAEAHLKQAVDDLDSLLLVGDIGTTKATLAVISPGPGPRAPLVETSFPTGDYHSLTAVVHEFLARVDLPVQRACFDVAGPVVDGRATISNLPWLMDEAVLATALHLSSVRLLNDVEALAYAIPHLEPTDTLTLNPGVQTAEGTLAVIAPDNGLGEAFLTWTGTHYNVRASEGGHADFAPADDLQIMLLQHLRSAFDHVSYERVCSGPGLGLLYEFLSQRGEHHPDGSEVFVGMAEGQDPAALIVDAALHSADLSTNSHATLGLFISILGAEAGNLALKVLATGGIYLGGSILPGMRSLVSTGQFMQALQSKGRSSRLLGRIPVYLVVNAKAPLLGAAYFGLAEGGPGRG